MVLAAPLLSEAAVLQCRTLCQNFAAAAVLACSAAGGVCVAAAAAEPIPNVALRSFNEGFEAYQQGQWVRVQSFLDHDTCLCLCG
jgi:poly(3-hydroxybutyrate) depolymerase